MDERLKGAFIMLGCLSLFLAVVIYLAAVTSPPRSHIFPKIFDLNSDGNCSIGVYFNEGFAIKEGCNCDFNLLTGLCENE